jgi:DNA repair protein RecN (Recombination protein N)
MKIIHLEIENYIIIERLIIDFDNKHNTIIGQSGSGKSLIVEAISFLLYGKNKDIRKIDSDAIVKAVLEVDDANEFITLKRRIRNGKTLLYLDDSIISQGEFEKQFLENVVFSMQGSGLKSKSKGYINFLIDKYLVDNIEYRNAKEKYNQSYVKLKNIKSEMEDILAQPRLDLAQIEVLKKENNQIEEYLLSDLKYEELLENQKRDRLLVKSAAKIQDNINLISQSDLLNQLQTVESMINNLTIEDRDIVILIKKMRLEIESYQFNLQTTIEGLDVDGFEKNETILYFNQIFRSNYGQYDQIINRILQNNYQVELSQDFDKIKFKYEQKTQKAMDELMLHGEKLAEVALSNTTKNIISFVSNTKEIGIKHDFKVEAQKVEATPNYLIEFNLVNDSGHKIMQIASGGEISRIDLLLTAAFNPKSRLFIWDEVDTGISGEIGFKVGKLIKKISKENQIIMISHLPQVTAFADKIIWVERSPKVLVTAESSRTGKIEMISSLLSGEKNTTAANENANQLVVEAEKYE